MIDLEEARQKYNNEDVEHPHYIFHGHHNLMDTIIPQKPPLNHSDNPEDTMVAVYGSTKLNGAIPYAIKIDGEYDEWEGRELLHWFVPPEYDYERALIEYGLIDEEQVGYIYVLDAQSFVKGNDYQWISPVPVTPIDIIKVKYEDVKGHFTYMSQMTPPPVK